MANEVKLSVVITARNEYPVILGTIYSFWEELVAHGIPFEIIVVSNQSTDSTPEILKDKFRRWIKAGLLRVLTWDERPANVMVRNVGAEAARGDAVILCDAHLSIKHGTVAGMLAGWERVGGLWHTCTQMWGDTDDIRCYAYDLRLEEKFWGNLCRGVPDEIKDERPMPAYPVPMASHCCILAGRQEYLDKRGYHPLFRCYGGGEPYLDLKWWLTGGKVWIYPEGLVRHAFGTVVHVKKAAAGYKPPGPVWVKGKGLSKGPLAEGDEYLHYARGYAWNNEQLHHNFLLSAYTIGGYPWLQKIYDRYREIRKGNSRYLEDLNELRRDVLKEGAEDRAWIAAHQTQTLDELLATHPWTDLGRRFKITPVSSPKSG